MRILIVEDEPDLLRSIAQALREEGYAVDTAADGEDGFYKAESYDYDAIVLDVMLPKMDGWEILKRLRTIKKTPVLMLTARDQTRDRVKGLDTGADDYVVKPFDLPELFARLRALIRRSTNKSTNVVAIGDVKIDTAARHVFLKDKIVELTARDQTRDRVKGLDAGADDYVVKPFDLEEVFARLRAIIRRSANKTTNLIAIGEVMVNTGARNVSLREKLVELTAREYSLVEFLALHRGEVVTRTQLYEHLFDENESSLSNLLDVHVSNVRKKLGAEFIATRRGHGYCIE